MSAISGGRARGTCSTLRASVASVQTKPPAARRRAHRVCRPSAGRLPAGNAPHDAAAPREAHGQSDRNVLRLGVDEHGLDEFLGQNPLQTPAA